MPYGNVTLESVFKKYIDTIAHPIIALETGCSHLFVPENFTNLSTLNIVEHLIKPTNGLLYSLDNDADHIEVCRHELSVRDLDQYVHFLQGNSVDRIKGLGDEHKGTINFVWHDSLEDSDHAYEEFREVQRLLSSNHVICVDDYGTASVKWQKISNHMKISHEYDFEEYHTPTGLFVGLKK